MLSLTRTHHTAAAFISRMTNELLLMIMITERFLLAKMSGEKNTFMNAAVLQCFLMLKNLSLHAQ